MTQRFAFKADRGVIVWREIESMEVIEQNSQVVTKSISLTHFYLGAIVRWRSAETKCC